MNDALKGKVAILTGASGGIGKVIADYLAKEGVNLALLGGRNVDALTATACAVKKRGVKCLVISGDLTDNAFLDGAVKKTAEFFGKIDILINNAGLAINCPFENVTEKQFDDVMDLDVKAPFFLTQKALLYLKKSDYATVINIASVVGHAGYPLQSPYVAAKHALLGFSKSLANEVYKDGVRVHVISPGGVLTDMIKISRPDLVGEDMIMPEDVAKTVIFLLQNRNGAVIDEIVMHRVNKPPFQV